MGTSVALPYPRSCHNRLNWREGNYGLLRAIFVKGTGVSVSLDSSCSPILLCGGKPSSPHRHCDGSPSIRPSRQRVCDHQLRKRRRIAAGRSGYWNRLVVYGQDSEGGNRLGAICRCECGQLTGRSDDNYSWKPTTPSRNL